MSVAQGGLALLAEHLPLLYPEITQQQSVTKPATGTSSGGGGNENSIAAELSDQDYEFVTQVKGISLGDIQVKVHIAFCHLNFLVFGVHSSS